MTNKKIKSSVESWQPCATLRGSAKALWLTLSLLQEHQETKPQMRAKSTSAITMLEPKIGSVTISNFTQRQWFCELPDSASSEPYASTSESDSDYFDYGALMDRHDQRDQLFQTGSSVSTESRSQRPNQSWQNHCWEHPQKFVGSNRLSPFVMSGVLKCFHRSHMSATKCETEICGRDRAVK